MITHTCVDIDLLSRDGKNFKWQKPSACPNCGLYLWGHGFVGRYFDDLASKLWLKRYRCPHCKIVITMIPVGRIQRFRYSLSHIFKTLIERLNFYQWPPWTTRQRAGHWMRRLKCYCQAHYGLTSEGLALASRVLELKDKAINFLDR